MNNGWSSEIGSWQPLDNCQMKYQALSAGPANAARGLTDQFVSRFCADPIPKKSISYGAPNG